MTAKRLLVLVAALALLGGAYAVYAACTFECPTPGPNATAAKAKIDELVTYCQACEECPNPSTTCNGNFKIELTDRTVVGNEVTFSYKVCETQRTFDLSHFIFSTAGITCLGTNPETGMPYELKDLVVAATWNGASLDPAYVKIGLDPTTQLYGIKFDVGADGCNTFSITFDTSKLQEGYTLGTGCILAATKAGNEDIRTPGPSQNPNRSPGYACILGPVCVMEEQEELCWQDETAWAAGTRYVKKGNWATYTPYVANQTVTLYAGRTMEAGTVHFSAPNNGKVTITVTLNEGWRFDPDEMENLKVQDYASAPSGNPAPGLFKWKKYCEGTSCSIEVPVNNFYGVHVDVQRQVPCPEE